MRPAAPLDEVLEFCNTVRKAGGGKPLNALLPGIPSDSDACLIAKNLNFECYVSGVDESDIDCEGKGYAEARKAIRAQEKNDTDGDSPWGMFVDDFKIVEKIGKATKLPYAQSDEGDGGVIILPRRIGNVAANFDKIADDYVEKVTRLMLEGVTRESAFNAARAELTRAMKPYLPLAEINEDSLAREAELTYRETQARKTEVAEEAMALA